MQITQTRPQSGCSTACNNTLQQQVQTLGLLPGAHALLNIWPAASRRHACMPTSLAPTPHHRQWCGPQSRTHMRTCVRTFVKFTATLHTELVTQSHDKQLRTLQQLFCTTRQTQPTIGHAALISTHTHRMRSKHAPLGFNIRFRTSLSDSLFLITMLHHSASLHNACRCAFKHKPTTCSLLLHHANTSGTCTGISCTATPLMRSLFLNAATCPATTKSIVTSRPALRLRSLLLPKTQASRRCNTSCRHRWQRQLCVTSCSWYKMVPTFCDRRHCPGTASACWGANCPWQGLFAC